MRTADGGVVEALKLVGHNPLTTDWTSHHGGVTVTSRLNTSQPALDSEQLRQRRTLCWVDERSRRQRHWWTVDRSRCRWLDGHRWNRHNHSRQSSLAATSRTT